MLAVLAGTLSTGAPRVEGPVAARRARVAFSTLGRAVFPIGFVLADDAFALAPGTLEDFVVADALGRLSLATTRVEERFFAAMTFSLFRIVVDDNGAALRSSRVRECSDGVLGTAKL